MTQAEQDYAHLHKVSHHYKLLESVVSLLDWDQETYMPPGAAGFRAQQLETLAGIIHSEKVGKKFASALSKLVDLSTGKVIAKLPAEKTAALHVWYRDYLKAKALPKRFVQEWTKLCSESVVAWRHAKSTNSFKEFAPFLEKIVSLSRKRADYFGYQHHPYDALLDEYEPETTTQQIETLFGSLRQSLVPLVNKISKAKQVDDSMLYGLFPQEKQLAFCNKILEAVGFHSTHGRVDVSTHPFSSTPHPHDSRITTRFHPTSLVNCIFIILHEVGHSLYAQGLPVEHYGSPLAESISLGMHESQSRWWETRIGQSKAFWKHFLPQLKDTFPELKNLKLETFYKAINKVSPSLIRVDADEVTYPLHVILRFEMERGLIEGSIKIKDVPQVWNAKMKDLIGIVPASDSEGCLQDIHWAMGAFGYFPSYTLGNLYASQFFDTFTSQHPNWEQQVAKGNLLFIVDWLRANIHRHGRRYPTSQELVKKVTGKSSSATPYITYLTKKYSEIYDL